MRTEDRLICNACTHQHVCLHKDEYYITHETFMEKLAEAPVPFKLNLRCRYFKEAKPKLSLKLLI